MTGATHAATGPHQAIRLSKGELDALAQVFYEQLRAYPDAAVVLFGSRADLAQRGGDIDLLVVSQAAAPHAYEVSKRLRIAIKDQLGDQRVDVLVSPPENAGRPAIVRLALLEGVQIWP
ncbi:MAG: nucleotidyltransferase domain-containing protein [Chloroflexi bacterium]|nr:nucleotidyltransferase domain-containing protein [Chloroflexota bacterium]